MGSIGVRSRSHVGKAGKDQYSHALLQAFSCDVHDQKEVTIRPGQRNSPNQSCPTFDNKLYVNQPSPVTKICGLAVAVSLTRPTPSLKGVHVTILS